MLKILNTKQIKAWDVFTIKNEPIASIDLMERACVAFVQWFTENFRTDLTVGIVCGTGNNGGDGLGIARLLSDWGYTVQVWIVKGTVSESIDFKVNRDRIPSKVTVTVITEKVDTTKLADCAVLIDALFGSGLSRPLEGIYAEVIQAVNAIDAVRVAVDIPSGLFADSHTTGVVFQAHHTITFQLPKLAFLMPENAIHVGEWIHVNIRLSKRYMQEVDASYFWLTRNGVGKKLKQRHVFAHKGDFGRALLVAGSYGKMGACVLAAKAAMRAGLGLLTVHVPKKGYEIVQVTVPEAMVSVDEDEYLFSTAPDGDEFTTIGLGPGLGHHAKSIKAFAELLKATPKPMVIDADGLNMLASRGELLHLLPPLSILTPHPGEFRRLVGDWATDFERLEKAKAFSNTTGCILVLKGAYTTIVSPEGKVYFNSTGNPGMAKGGSGDVLTGVLIGLLSQSIPPLDAAILGVYLHGAAGDLAVYEKGEHSLIASDIIEFLPAAFKSLHR